MKHLTQAKNDDQIPVTSEVFYEAMKEFWSDPIKRERFRELLSVFWDEYRIDLVKILNQRNDRSKFNAVVMRKFWNDPIKREKVSALCNEFWNVYRGELRDLMSTAWHSLWQNKAWREKRIAEIRASWADPEYQQKWAAIRSSPKYREAHKAGVKAMWTPERRQKLSNTIRGVKRPKTTERFKAKWADPAFREKMKGKVWWHRGDVETKSATAPGPDWIRGRVPGRKRRRKGAAGGPLWWHCGVLERKSATSPGPDWLPGRAPGQKIGGFPSPINDESHSATATENAPVSVSS